MSVPFVGRTQIHEYEPHKFVVFASDLGFAPGYVPETIQTDAGNGQLFVLDHITNEDTWKAVYTQQLGCITLTIYND